MTTAQVKAAFDSAEDIADPLDGLAEKVPADPGAPFVPAVLERLGELKRTDRAAFEVLRARLKKAGCRVTALDDAIADENGDAGGRRPSQADILIGLAASAESREVRSFDREFDARGLDQLRLDIPLGALEIEGTSGDRIEVEVRIECHFRKSRCRDLAEDVDLVGSTFGDELVLELDGLKKWKSLGMEFTIQVKAPATLELEVDFGVGSLDIRGFDNDITVDQGIGELNVTMAESQVESVDIDAGVGEANMRYAGGRLETSGIFGNDLRWNDGTGTARVRLELGIGEVDLRLR